MPNDPYDIARILTSKEFREAMDAVDRAIADTGEQVKHYRRENMKSLIVFWLAIGIMAGLVIWVFAV